jgi:hypothetical protein
MKAIAVISPHEKDFWQADIYEQGFSEDTLPDWFCTGKKGGDKDEIIAKVRAEFPGIEFTDGVTGVCADCGEEHFNLEEECSECGGVVDDC